MKLAEKHVQRQIVDYLRVRGWFVAETSTRGYTFATPGLPDVIALKETGFPGVSRPEGKGYPRTLWIEVKGPRGRQSEAQEAFEVAVKEQGGEYLLMSSLEQLMAYLLVDN